jgi:uncharacterized membrane protein (UPF0182 family)
VSGVFGLIFGFKLKRVGGSLRCISISPHLHARSDIFGKSLGFYLFSLPFYDLISSWLLGVTFIILVAAVAYSLLGLPQTVLKPSVRWSSGAAFRGVCCSLALFFVVLSWRTYLSRGFHFSGRITRRSPESLYTDAHYTLPALLIVAIALIVAAIILAR